MKDIRNVGLHNRLCFVFVSSRWALIHTVERQLISEHLQSILGKGLENLLDNNRLHDLKLLYSLFARVKNGLIDLCFHFNSYIKVLDGFDVYVGRNW